MTSKPAPYRPDPRHLALGPTFYDEVQAAKFPQTVLRLRNQRWAEQVGLGELDDAQWLAHFGSFEPLPGNLPTPLALRYHGHQFRSYNPEIGDGRGFLFAQLRDDTGRLLDLGTKGSGQTPWSRRGDGRLTLKGGVREALATAMLEALGVDTSRTFSLVETGEALMRHDEPSPTRGCVLVRLSHGHIRIGSFQRLLALGDREGMARLLAYSVEHYAPEAARPNPEETAMAFLETVQTTTARTCARWMAAGFVHGVLNTDNINITGESFDYGPYRFLPAYDPGFTAAYFDEWGLYAFGRQPETIAWNLARLAECLSMLVAASRLEPVLARFSDVFWEEMRCAITRRLGLARASAQEDDDLIAALFGWLRATQVPFEAAMFDLYGGAARQEQALAGPRSEPYRDGTFAPLAAALRHRSAADTAQTDHAYFALEAPVRLLYDDIEALWSDIADRDDWAAFEAKLTSIERVRGAYGFA